ncbi:ThiF family adenylyltransferase [Shewanella sp. 4t3-1-2LB]|uniref:ThiF family adenylyltransferase n=1 Tax=Shewanella sp. 4t3-1-2LB TaxID=2817682 RepID=UPI001A997B74|nr:ThiF family adenylyltransferase [Shewanella sp. 4t3-1-2LB]MBO1273612.1 ThiF family adenylyltransferase [Shewanella sp. 4t3-1-2LB]
MRKGTTLVFDGVTHQQLKNHLITKDQKESAAILLCTNTIAKPMKLLVCEVIFVPHNECDRQGDELVWPGSYLEKAIDHAELDNLSIVVIHSHPGGYWGFSSLDDESDKVVMTSLSMALPSGPLHGSAIMIPSGAVKARLYNRSYEPQDIELVAIYGDDFQFFWSDAEDTNQRPMAFSNSMSNELARLSIAVVGVSGTGSIVAEQLARMGVGSITVVDYDRIEHKNLNRILNSKLNDADTGELKVDLFKRSVKSFSPNTDVTAVPFSIFSKKAIYEVSKTDILFCCVDSQIGRNVCDLLSSAFLMPLFDVGVVIPIRKQQNGSEAILDINIRIDYVQPRKSSLFDRGVYTSSGVAAEDLASSDFELYEKRVQEGYMPGSIEEAPSVISANMKAAAICVQEFISRTYPYRLNSNSKYARTIVSLAECENEYTDESSFSCSPYTSVIAAKAFKSPLLGIPALEDEK